MRCLDTPPLQDILTARRGAKSWLDKLETWSGEVGTTEVNMIELAQIAKEMGKGLDRRLSGLDVLRRELTVLPVDRESTRVAVDLIRKNPRGFSPVTLLVASTAVAHGATHLMTTKKRPYPGTLTPLRLIYL